MDGGMMSNASSLESVFLFCAAAGTAFFVIRFIMLFIGGAADGLDAGDVDVDMDMDEGDADVSDAQFSVLSINSITAFFMMFGWSGLTCYKQFSLGPTQSIFIALIVGVLCMLITAYLFKLARKLVSRGTTFKIAATVGKTASVYQEIPAEGRGRINFSISGSNTRELDAVSEDKKEIASFKTVEIIKVVDNTTVSVREVS